MLVVGLLLAGCSAASDDSVLGELQDMANQASEAELDEAPSDEVWDLVYIQDSLGFGVADRYAEHIRTASGADVVVHDKAIGNLQAVTVLSRLRGNHFEDWPELVRNAEIIVLFGNPDGSGTTSDIGTCISGSTSQREPPLHNSEEDWRPYREVLDDVYQEIWKIREDVPVILRAVEFINPAISAWREAGIEKECTEALEAMNRTIRDAALNGGATVVSTYDLYNGPQHEQDPREKGWIGPDGTHLSNEGEQAIADALAASGLSPNQAP